MLVPPPFAPKPPHGFTGCGRRTEHAALPASAESAMQEVTQKATLPFAVTLLNAANFAFFVLKRPNAIRGKAAIWTLLASPLQRPWWEAIRYDRKAFVRRNWLELCLRGAQSCWHGLWLHTTDPLKRIVSEIKAWLNLLKLSKFLACSEIIYGTQRLEGVVVGTCLEWTGSSRTKWYLARGYFHCNFGILGQKLYRIKPLSIQPQ